MTQKVLLGKKILVTRARGQSGDFTLRLKKLGAEVIEFPLIEIIPPLTWKGLDRGIDRLTSYHWIIFTSANGVHFFRQRLKERRKNTRLPAGVKVCAIGPVTSISLKEWKVPVHFVPKEHIAEAVLQHFKKTGIQGKDVLLVHAQKARDVLQRGLKKMGARVDVAEAYRTIKPRGGASRLKRILTHEKIDLLTFASSSTVNHFVKFLGKEDLKKRLRGKIVACIGPMTVRTAKAWGMKVPIQPKDYTIPALTRAISNYVVQKRGC